MNEKVIWDYFFTKLKNQFGVAGLMGNIYVESHLDPQLLQSSYARKLGLSSKEYTEAVDNQSYTNFVHDGAGYGLAQWTYYSRKEGLLEEAKKRNCSIGDLDMQLDYLWTEIQKYKTVVSTLQSAKSIREASDIVALRYEKPKDTSDKALANRAQFGEKYYEMFADKPRKGVIITSNLVNIRKGNGKQYGRWGQAKKNTIFEWVATSENYWHAIVYKDVVAWVSGEFSKINE